MPNKLKYNTSTVKGRLLRFIDYLDAGGQGKFEARVGLSNGYINNIKGSIGGRAIERIKKMYPTLNTEWVLFGGDDNEMIIVEKNGEIESKELKGAEQPINNNDLLQEYMKKVIDLQEQLINKNNDYRIKFQFNPKNTFTWKTS